MFRNISSKVKPSKTKKKLKILHQNIGALNTKTNTLAHPLQDINHDTVIKQNIASKKKNSLKQDFKDIILWVVSVRKIKEKKE